MPDAPVFDPVSWAADPPPDPPVAGAVPGYLPPRPPPVDVIAELNAIEELEPEFPMVAAPTPAPPAPIVNEKLPVSTVVAV